MRTLRFIVDDQILKPDPNCDFDNLIPGTEGYLQAEFTFSKKWNNCAKIATFWSVMGVAYGGEVLRDGKNCSIPADALKKRKFKIQIVGINRDLKLVTNKLVISQNGGKT